MRVREFPKGTVRLRPVPETLCWSRDDAKSRAPSPRAVLPARASTKHIDLRLSTARAWGVYGMGRHDGHRPNLSSPVARSGFN